MLIGFLQPLTAADTVRALADRGVTSFAMEAIPRITRAQSMDALSSQATVSGYRAALLAAQELPRFFPMLTTAAGTIRPGEGAGARRRGGGPAGDRHRPPARRGRAGLRRALGREGADRVARRPLPGARHGPRGRRGRRRLRPPAHRRGAAAPARAARRGDREDGRRDLHGRRARPPRAAARDRAGREEHEPRLRDRGPRRRDRRQLRAHRARPDRREGGRDHRRTAEPARHDARPRVEPVLPQRAVAARA